MAAMNEPREDLDLRRYSEILGREIAQMQEELERLIQVTGLKNDPVLPLIKVLSSSLRLQWRLHNQAVRYFHDASDRLDREYHDTLKKTALAVQQAEAVLQTKQAEIVEQLTPKLADSVRYAVYQHGKTVKYKTLGIWAIQNPRYLGGRGARAGRHSLSLHLCRRAECRAVSGRGCLPSDLGCHEGRAGRGRRLGPADAG
ncbi:MAG: hypothetical protein B7Z75_14630 [Acidocella sp. 20-57-95]|nr:MAG: hypothetical protein B7Z75_14630 [Acidocella sp. 20-57-95]